MIPALQTALGVAAVILAFFGGYSLLFYVMFKPGEPDTQFPRPKTRRRRTRLWPDPSGIWKGWRDRPRWDE